MMRNTTSNRQLQKTNPDSVGRLGSINNLSAREEFQTRDGKCSASEMRTAVRIARRR
jgi:hypothetical protein